MKTPLTAVWSSPGFPTVRTGKKVAIIGSGPSGLAAADQLNRRGHSVTVYERFDRAGGLLMYGIPNMKLDKSVVLRRIHLMEQEGVQFVYNANVGENTDAQEILDQYDAVILCCGASNPRDLTAPGRDAKGIYFAVDYLRANTKSLLDSAHSDGNYINAKGKNVLVVGGGDTGNDCVGTAIRQGCKHVIQFEMMGKPPIERLPSNPWPQWPNVLKTDYGQEEAIYLQGEDPRIYNTTVEEFLKDDQGNLTGVTAVNLSWAAAASMTELDTYAVDVRHGAHCRRFPGLSELCRPMPSVSPRRPEPAWPRKTALTSYAPFPRYLPPAICAGARALWYGASARAGKWPGRWTPS